MRHGVLRMIRRLGVLCGLLFALTAAPAFAATYVVATTGDAGTGSLREAIALANANPGADTISFNIVDAAGLPKTIALSSALPFITSPVSIDGTSRAGLGGRSGSRARRIGDDVRLRPGAAGRLGWKHCQGTDRRRLSLGRHPHREQQQHNREQLHRDERDRRLRPCQFGRRHRDFQRHGNVIGGTTVADRNVISGNGGDGVYVGPGLAGGTDSNTITGNFIGVDRSGSVALGNVGRGVTVYSSSNLISGNVISANSPNIDIPGGSRITSSGT